MIARTQTLLQALICKHKGCIFFIQYAYTSRYNILLIEKENASDHPLGNLMIPEVILNITHCILIEDLVVLDETIVDVIERISEISKRYEHIVLLMKCAHDK